MRRLFYFLVFMVLATLAAGVFGAVHDQISYTVAPEYYTRFKFLQFRLLDPSVPERLRAAQVGFLASWWMGLPIGLFTGVAGFMQRSAARMRQALLWSLLVITGFTLACALGGLVYGFFRTATLNLGDYSDWFVPAGLQHPRNFICVGYMHNCAYLGGTMAIPTAWLFHLLYRRAPGAEPQM